VFSFNNNSNNHITSYHRVPHIMTSDNDSTPPPPREDDDHPATTNELSPLISRIIPIHQLGVLDASAPVKVDNSYQHAVSIQQFEEYENSDAGIAYERELRRRQRRLSWGLGVVMVTLLAALVGFKRHYHLGDVVVRADDLLSNLSSTASSLMSNFDLDLDSSQDNHHLRRRITSSTKNESSSSAAAPPQNGRLTSSWETGLQDSTMMALFGMELPSSA
jgi:hypothetical protein